ncbi:MAG: TIGR03643 family protein [Gammaproteobacteria bacterium]|nr:TIGR03643 family protein [Gammaproteobacteria bacterium]|tara:strand:- start:32153 stop:32359 length:207 start_codon:yes stop_codon:yes gene_type:complete
MKKFSEIEISEIIEMALSDDVPFKSIEDEYGINADQIKQIMKNNISLRSYKIWRKRVKEFSTRRKFYK